MHVGQRNIVKNNRKLKRKGGKPEKMWSNRHIINEVLPKGCYKREGLKTLYNRSSLKPYHDPKNSFREDVTADAEVVSQSSSESTVIGGNMKIACWMLLCTLLVCCSISLKYMP